MRFRLIAALIALLATSSSLLAQTKVVLGKLGQITAATKIYARPSSTARVYYRAKAYEYIVLNPYKTPDWYRVLLQNKTYGYVQASKVAELPYQVTMPSRQAPRISSPNSGMGEPAVASRGAGAAANYALNFIGTPYQWGGEDLRNGIDCSGLVLKCFGKIGVNLPRTADEQSRVGMKITRLEDLQAGDRLYFWSKSRGKIGHTGIYLGNGYFVHASSNHGKVATDYLGTQHWLNMLVDARR